MFSSKLFVIGLLSLLSSAGTAHAAGCENNLEDLLKPISSHYTKIILERADKGIDNADGVIGTFDTSDLVSTLYWIKRYKAFFAALVDSRSQIVESEERLRRTACMNIDLLLIEGKMDQVRCEMQSALETGRGNKLEVLNELLQFLNERWRHLFLGGTDPRYEDVGFYIQHTFDQPPSVWCCSLITADENVCTPMTLEECNGEPGQAYDTLYGCITDDNGCSGSGYLASSSTSSSPSTATGAVCPFHSNYLPPTGAGYGCGLWAFTGSVLEPDAPELKSITSEQEAMKILMDLRAELKENVSENINNYLAASNPELAEFFNSFEDPGPGGKKPFYGCEGRRVVTPEEDDDDNYNGEKVLPNPIYQTGATKWEIRGPFSLQKNQPSILQRLYEWRRKLGANRGYPKDLLYSYEIENDDSSSSANRVQTGFEVAEKMSNRLSFLRFSILQSGRESNDVTRATDLNRQMRTAFGTSLRKAVAKYSTLSRDTSKGVRGFARDYAFFLRRSCVFRPCNEQLDKLLKILLEDSCFPYTSGEYLGGGQSYEKCESDADL